MYSYRWARTFCFKMSHFFPLQERHCCTSQQLIISQQIVSNKDDRALFIGSESFTANFIYDPPKIY